MLGGLWGQQEPSSEIKWEQVGGSVARPFPNNSTLSEQGENTFTAPMGNEGLKAGLDEKLAETFPLA